MKRTLLLILVALLPILANAYDAEIDGIYYNFSGNGATVTYASTSYNSYSGTIVIPASVTYNGNTYTVTNIGVSAFERCTNLASITIPNSVTSIGASAFRQCTNLVSFTIPISVKSIGASAFERCTNLVPIIIPNSVTTIGVNAFYNCSGLTSITIPSSVTSLGNSAFAGCNALKIVTLESNAIVSLKRSGNSMKSIFGSQVTEYMLGGNVQTIGQSAFDGCTCMTSIFIPNSVKSIGHNAFRDCSGLTSITIPESVQSIGVYAFDGCSSLTSVIVGWETPITIEQNTFSNRKNATLYVPVGSKNNYVIADFWKEFRSIIELVPKVDDIYYSFNTESKTATVVSSPDSEKYKGDVIIPNFITYSGKTYTVTSIGDLAFYGCSGLTSITIPECVTTIGNNAFSGCNAKLYVNRGTDALLAVWNYGTEPYEVGTDTILSRPSLSVLSTTQSTITYQINNFYPELEYDVVGNPVSEGTYIITDLRPNYTENISLTIRSANNSYSCTSVYGTTSPISPTVRAKNITASSLSVEGTCAEGDANIVSTSVTIEGAETKGNKGTKHGLNPNTSYNCKYKVVVEYGDGETYTYEGSNGIRTSSLTITTQQPKVINVGNVIVAAISNLDDEETNVGFEWRRTDWTDEFASNAGTAYLYNGKMEGYIRNLYTEKLWKYRPYYESDSGNRYYGEWVGIDPTNTSYFEPTVHTYAQISVTGNRAEVKGYAMRGTDNVQSQGFMYWQNNTSVSLRRRAASVPSGTTVVNASGNIMTATLEDLEYETTYNYVAFVTTSEGETFYGEMQTFTTSFDPDGIEEVKSSEETTEVARYDLQGRMIAKLQKGINIIRYSDGTSKKVLVK